MSKIMQRIIFFIQCNEIMTICKKKDCITSKPGLSKLDPRGPVSCRV